jgi:hypothetical protein
MVQELVTFGKRRVGSELCERLLRLSAFSIMSGLRFLPGMSNADLDEVALRLLNNTFQHPIPSFCVVKIIGLLNMLTNPSHADVAADNLRRKDRAFTSVSRWFSLRRSRDQVQTVLTMHCMCSRRDAAEDVHISGAEALEYNSGPDRPPGEVLLHACIGILRHAQEHHPGESVKLHRFSERKAWPFTTKQILPHGDDTIRGYFDWMVTEDVPTFQQVLEVFTGHLGYGWTLTVLPVIKNRLFLDQFIHAATHWTTYATKLLQRLVGQAKDESHPDQILSIFFHMSLALRTIVHACSDRATATFFLHKRFNEVLIACDRMTTTASLLAVRFNTEHNVEASKQTGNNFILVGSTIYNHFPGSRASTSQLSSHDVWILHAHRLEIPHIVMWASLLDTLIYLYIRQRCSAPGCMRTSEGHRYSFGYCKGCLRVPYCSRTCQKNAWRREDGLQHRDVCALIRRICTRHKIARTRTARTESPRVPALSDQDVKAVGAINTHFALLTRHELQG